MQQSREYSPHFHYAKIKKSSKYRYQHSGFFPIKQHKHRLGLWIGNDNLYPESDIDLFEYQSKQGFFQLGNTSKNIKNRNYYLDELELLGLHKPNLQDLKLRELD